MAQIREARPADVPAITEIQNALIGSTSYEWREAPHTLAGRRAWLTEKQAHGFPVLVAEDPDSGAVVGWAAYGDFRDSVRWPGYRFVVEHTIHVRGDQWGNGIGQALLDGLIERASAAGIRVMIAAIDGANTRSIEFHARLGFDEVGRLPGIGDKFGQRLDLVLMQRDLTS